MTTHYSDQELLALPKEQVLGLSEDDRLRYFKAVRLRHPKVSRTMAELRLMSKPGVGSNITLLVGPTGVGKSTVVNGFRDQILIDNQERMREDLALIPIVLTETPASGERGFSWRIFYQKLGEGLQEPLMLKKQETRTNDGRVTVRPVSTVATVSALRTAVEKALVYRKTSIVVLDEAVHLLRNIHGNTLENHMDAIKSLANICGLNIILIGSYDLLPLIRLSAQVARRSSIVHFPRYLTGERNDEQTFAKVLNMLTSYLPLEGKVDLSSYSVPLQKACAGCVGILKDTLSRALTFALADGGKWEESHLEMGLLPVLQLSAILEETLQGEQKMLTTALGSGSFKAAAEKYRDIELMVMGAS